MAGGLRLDVRSNVKEITAGIDRDVRAIERATGMALNRTIQQLRTNADRDIRARYNIKLQTIRAATRLVKASAKAGRYQAEVIYTGLWRVPLIKFGAKQTKRGVTVRVLKAGGRKLIPHAFITKTKSGHVGVFVRANVGKGPVIFRHGPGSRIRRSNERDLPIRELKTADLPTLYGRKVFVEKQLRFADSRFDKNLGDALNAVFRR